MQSIGPNRFHPLVYQLRLGRLATIGLIMFWLRLRDGVGPTRKAVKVGDVCSFFWLIGVVDVGDCVCVGGRAKVLRKADVTVIETDTCREWYKSQGKKTKIQDTQICAGREQGGVDSCWVSKSLFFTTYLSTLKN